MSKKYPAASAKVPAVKVPVSAKASSASSSKGKTQPVIVYQPNVRILKVATCQSLSGRTKLTYNIGHVPEGEHASESANDNAEQCGIYLRIYSSTGRGFFSHEWIKLSGIQEIFAKVPEGQCPKSELLHPLFRGKSSNTHGFLWSVLQQEGFVRRLQDKKRGYECVEPVKFLAEVQALIDSGVTLKSADLARLADIKL